MPVGALMQISAYYSSAGGWRRVPLKANRSEREPASADRGSLFWIRCSLVRYVMTRRKQQCEIDR